MHADFWGFYFGSPNPGAQALRFSSSTSSSLCPPLAVTGAELSVNGKLLGQLARSPVAGYNQWGACVAAVEGGGGKRERSICCGGARGTAASGGPAGSQSESDPDAPLFALRAEMNENTTTMGEPRTRTPSA